MERIKSFTNPTLTEYYKNYIEDERHKDDSSRPPLVIDLTSTETFDLQEVRKFLIDYYITDIVFKIDNAVGFEKVLSQLPTNNFNKMKIEGNLNGLSVFDAMDRNGENGIHLNNLHQLVLEHTGGEPAKIDCIPIPVWIDEVRFRNIGSVNRFSSGNVKSSFSGKSLSNPAYITYAFDEISYGMDLESINPSRLDLREIPREKVDFKKIKKRFPHLDKLELSYDSAPMIYEDRKAMIEELLEVGHIKTQRGQLEKIRMDLVKYSKKSPDQLNEMLLNLVELSDGTYIDSSRIKAYSKNTIFSAKENSFENQPAIVLEIPEITELSLQEALQLKQKFQGKKEICIKVEAVNSGPNSKGVYSLDKYIAILNRYNEIIEGLSSDIPQEKRFAKIYERVLKGMMYDYKSAHTHSKSGHIYSEASAYSSRNDEAVLNGKGVCAAFARAIEVSCALNRIECKYIGGSVDFVSSKMNDKKNSITLKRLGIFKGIESEPHAWNKVRLRGRWYNVDGTWDAPLLNKNHMPKYFLLSDKTMLRTGRREMNGDGPECTTDADESLVSQLFPEMQRGSNRKLYYDKQILKYETGEKLSDVVPNVFQRLLERTRLMFSRQGSLLQALPESSTNEEMESSPVQSDPAWALSPSEKMEFDRNVKLYMAKRNEMHDEPANEEKGTREELR